MNIQVQIQSDFLDNFSGYVKTARDKALQEIEPDGKEILRAEMPEQSGTLKGDVQSEQDTDSITYIASAKSDTGYDYAVGIVEGTGLYGERKERILPKKGKVLKIPVENLSLGNSKLQARDGFIFVRSTKGQKPNPFDARAAKEMADKLPSQLADAFIENL